MHIDRDDLPHLDIPRPNGLDHAQTDDSDAEDNDILTGSDLCLAHHLQRIGHGLGRRRFFEAHPFRDADQLIGVDRHGNEFGHATAIARDADDLFSGRPAFDPLAQADNAAGEFVAGHLIALKRLPHQPFSIAIVTVHMEVRPAYSRCLHSNQDFTCRRRRTTAVRAHFDRTCINEIGHLQRSSPSAVFIITTRTVY